MNPIPYFLTAVAAVSMTSFGAPLDRLDPFANQFNVFATGKREMPGGALGIWYADQYQSTAAKVVPNSIGGVQVSSNLLGAPRRMFSNTEWWSRSGETIADSAASAPDGSSDASTAIGTGNWLIRPTTAYTVPTGTYTLAVNAKRNTGSDQQFCFSKDNTVTRSSVNTATSSWQRFSYTFTLVASTTTDKMLVCSIDGSTGANLQLCDFELYPGASDLGPQTFAGHLYLGASAFDTRPTYSSGAIDLSSSAYGLIQFPSSTTYSTVTAIAVASKVAAGSSYQAMLSKVQNYQHFTAFMELSTAPRLFLPSNDITFSQTTGLWTFLNKGYFFFASRYDGTKADVFLNDNRMVTKTASISSFSSSDFFVNIVNTNGLASGYKFSAIALYNRALSDAEVRLAYAVLSARAAVSSISLVTNRIYVAEGDSITGGGSFDFPYKFGPNASPAVQGANYGTNGATIADLAARAATVDAVIPPNPGSRKYILSVLIGRNDLLSLGNSTYLTNLASYLDARRAAGWKVVLCTLLPSTASNFNAARNTVNTTMAGWAGVHCDAVADFGAEPTMGPDAAASDTNYYSDGTHPTDAGQTLLEAVIRPVINGL